MMTPLEIAKVVLEMSNTGTHVSEMANIAVAGGLVVNVSPEDFAKKLSSALAISVKRPSSIFAKVVNQKLKPGPDGKPRFKKGFYRLKRGRLTVQEPTIIPEPEPTTHSGFTGKAGEYAVMSELLFLEFNVSLMTVDRGIDIVAQSPKGAYKHIQVKTSNSKDGVYQFSIGKQSFLGAHSGMTYYVLVLRKESRNDFVIFPSSQIATYADAGVIKGSQSLSLRVSYDNKTRRYSLNNMQDVSIFVNKWALIGA